MMTHHLVDFYEVPSAELKMLSVSYGTAALQASQLCHSRHNPCSETRDGLRNILPSLLWHKPHASPTHVLQPFHMCNKLMQHMGCFVCKQSKSAALCNCRAPVLYCGSPPDQVQPDRGPLGRSRSLLGCSQSVAEEQCSLRKDCCSRRVWSGL